jgi:hypothetical protein
VDFLRSAEVRSLKTDLNNDEVADEGNQAQEQGKYSHVVG